MIINVGSVALKRTLPGSAAYTATKYGLSASRRVLAEEMRPHGVRVGVTRAGGDRHAALGRIANPPDRARMVRPDQVAAAACSTASPTPTPPSGSAPSRRRHP